MRLLLQNNICKAHKYIRESSIIYYAPIYRSDIQKKFFIERFEELKETSLDTQVVFTQSIDQQDYDIAFSWDAAYERNTFKDKLSPLQNRLFEDFDFQMPNSFTSFRKRAELLLPDSYSEASIPFDKEIINEINYYFSKTQLPLTYFETRNKMIGRDYSTKFSAYLSCGFLDVRYLYNKVKEFEQKEKANKSTNWIIFELLWREFFYWHYQQNKDSYFSKNGLKGEADYSAYRSYIPAELMKMDVHPFFKSAITELTTTGFLSNRARQMFASIWINDLKLDWRSGADFFEKYLIDYDVYSNYGNWMYLAGVGVDPRGKRYFNIDKQLSQYDPDGLYIKKWN